MLKSKERTTTKVEEKNSTPTSFSLKKCSEKSFKEEQNRMMNNLYDLKK